MLRSSALLAAACAALLGSFAPRSGAATPAVAENVVEAAVEAIQEYDSGQLRGFHGHYSSLSRLVMPSPGLGMPAFRKIAFPESAFYYVEFNIPGADDIPLVQLAIDDESYVVITDGNHLLLKASGGEPMLKAPRRKPEQSSGSIQIHMDTQGYRLCLNQRCRTVESAAGVRDGIHARAAGGEVLLFNPQVAGHGPRDWEPPNAVRTVEAPAPRRVLSWERISKALYHLAITFDAARKICSTSSFHLPHGCDEVLTRAPDIARDLALQLSRWRNWRTFDATAEPQALALDPKFSAWDKGNWANGYLPYATVLLGIVADGGAHGDTTRSILPAYRRLGEAYLGNELFHTRAGHWIKRSNNHGAIILGNGYAAQLLANQCQEDKLSESLRRSFRSVAEGSFRDGVYIESFNYLQVFILESLPAVYIRQHCFGESFDAAFSELYGDVRLSEVAAASDLLTMPTGRILAPFGDCCGTSAWRADSLELLGRAVDSMAQLAQLGLYTAEGNTALLYLSDGGHVSDSAASSDASASHGGKTFGPGDGTLECFSSGVGLVVARAQTSFGPVQSAALSTRLHLTHNRDWDLGSVYLAVAGEFLIGERVDGDPAQLRHATRHSTAWSSLTAERYPGCFGGEDGNCGNRKTNGAVTSFDAGGQSCAARLRLSGSDRASRQWTLESSDPGEVRLRLDDYLDPSVDGERLMAHFELPADLAKLPGQAGALRIRRPAWEAEIRVEGYAIEALERRTTTHGSYTSLDLATDVLKSGKAAPAGSLIVVIRAVEGGPHPLLQH